MNKSNYKTNFEMLMNSKSAIEFLLAFKGMGGIIDVFADNYSQCVLKSEMCNTFRNCDDCKTFRDILYLNHRYASYGAECFANMDFLQFAYDVEDFIERYKQLDLDLYCLPTRRFNIADTHEKMIYNALNELI